MVANNQDIDPKVMSSLLEGLPGEAIETGTNGGNSNNNANDYDDDDAGTGTGNDDSSKGKGTGGKAVNIEPDLFLTAFGLKPEEIDTEEVKTNPGIIADKVQQKFLEKMDPVTRFLAENSGKPGFDMDEFLSSLKGTDVSKMSSDEVISEYMYSKYGRYDEEKNPDGLTEDDIKQELSRMTKVQRKQLEESAREFLFSQKGKSLNEYAKKLNELSEKQFNETVENQKKNAERILKEVKVSDVYGMKISDADKKAYDEQFVSIITPRKETGIAPLLEMIYNMDDEGLYKLGFLLWATEDRFKNYVSEITSGTKKKIIDKLQSNPRRNQSMASTSTDEIDISKLAQPE